MGVCGCKLIGCCTSIAGKSLYTNTAGAQPAQKGLEIKAEFSSSQAQTLIGDIPGDGIEGCVCCPPQHQHHSCLPGEIPAGINAPPSRSPSRSAAPRCAERSDSGKTRAGGTGEGRRHSAIGILCLQSLLSSGPCPCCPPTPITAVLWSLSVLSSGPHSCCPPTPVPAVLYSLSLLSSTPCSHCPLVPVPAVP